MRLRQSAEDGVKAQETFPGLSLPETQSRLSRRHLQKLHRAADPPHTHAHKHAHAHVRRGTDVHTNAHAYTIIHSFTHTHSQT